MMRVMTQSQRVRDFLIHILSASLGDSDIFHVLDTPGSSHIIFFGYVLFTLLTTQWHPLAST